MSHMTTISMHIMIRDDWEDEQRNEHFRKEIVLYSYVDIFNKFPQHCYRHKAKLNRRNLFRRVSFFVDLVNQFH